MREEQARSDIRSIESSLEKRVSGRALDLKQFLDSLMPVALIGLGSLIVFHLVIPVGETLSRAVNVLNIVLILFFSVRFLVSFGIADSHREFLKNHWFDAVLVLPALAVLREARLFMLLESKTEERAFMGFFFARNTTVAGQVAKMYRIVRRTLRL